MQCPELTGNYQLPQPSYSCKFSTHLSYKDHSFTDISIKLEILPFAYAYHAVLANRVDLVPTHSMDSIPGNGRE